MIKIKTAMLMLLISLLGVGTIANLLGCASPVTNSLLKHGEPRIETVGFAKSARMLNNKLHVEYQAKQSPVSHGGIVLKKHSKWMTIDHATTNPAPNWNRHSEYKTMSMDANAIDIPVYFCGKGSSIKDCIKGIDDKFFIISCSYAYEGFYLIYRQPLQNKLSKDHFIKYTNIPASLWRYPSYILIPVTLLYDVITFPLWIKDTIFFNDI